ncbi:MAG: metallophosphoesterase family protein [Bryobacteraceae bacterium]
MRYLIVSDIHANWEALAAVLEQASGEYDRIVCLGDLVGYGPDPNPVVEWVKANCAVVVRGNHDRAASGIESLEWFNPVARTAAIWTQQELTADHADYVRALPPGPMPFDSFQISHGSPLEEDGYVVTSRDAMYLFPYLERDLTFFGHTHLQGGFVWAQEKVQNLGTPQVEDGQLAALELRADHCFLLNPGAVGQPRDGDPRAAYAIYVTEEKCVYYARVEYDVGSVQKKIRAAGLPDSLADRLAVGR